MASADDHAKVILSAILPDRLDLLERAINRVVPEHIVDTNMRQFYTLLVKYHEHAHNVLTRTALSDLLRGRGFDKTILFEELYDSLAEHRVSESDFSWSIYQLRELAAERETLEAFTYGTEILRSGVVDPKLGELRGQKDAWDWLAQKHMAIEHGLAMQESPEGNMRAEANDMLSDYMVSKNQRLSGIQPGVNFGIPSLDRFLDGGLQRGELIMLAGGSGDGKTSACSQLAWSAAVEQGKNVLFLTTETIRTQVRRRILSRHSKMDKFGLVDGLNSKNLKNGTLTEEEEAVLQQVVQDFTMNPTYGVLHIAQIPRGATIETCEAKLYNALRAYGEVDLVIMDYLALLSSLNRRGTDREELSGIIKAAKQVATTFNDGKGVPFVSPWQINRSGQDNAKRTGYYDLSNLAETAEAVNSADIAISILGIGESDQRYREMKAQLLKNRDGETSNSISLSIDYATNCLTDYTNTDGESSGGLFDTPQEDDTFIQLLGS